MAKSTVRKTAAIELVMLFLTGAGHVTLELLSDGARGAAVSFGRPQHIFNLCAVICWGGYLLFRLFTKPGLLLEWGVCKKGFAASFKASLIFAAVASVPLFVIGVIKGNMPLPSTFFLLLLLYPFYGLAQQLGLQVMITRNIREFIKPLPARAFVASLLFGAAHFPNMWLVLLTFASGFGFTWIYEKHRNIWAVGIIHGILGSLAYYLVLGEDPGRELIRYIYEHYGAV